MLPTLFVLIYQKYVSKSKTPLRDLYNNNDYNQQQNPTNAYI